MRAGTSEQGAAAWLADEREFVLSICRRVCGPELAEDACQEALARAWQALERGVRPNHRRAWLATIARRAALDLASAERSVRISSASESLNDDSAVAAIQSAEQEALLRERVRAIVAAAGELPPRQRQALMMRELEGASYGTIVTRLGAEGTAAVRELIRRARIRLRQAALGIAQLPLPTALRETLARLLASGSEPLSAGSSGATLAKLAALAAAGSVVVGAPLLEHSSQRPQRSLPSDAAAPAAVERAPRPDRLGSEARAHGDRSARSQRAVARSRGTADDARRLRGEAAQRGSAAVPSFAGRDRSQTSDEGGDHGDRERSARDHGEALGAPADSAREDAHAADGSDTADAGASADAPEAAEAAPSDSQSGSDSTRLPESQGSEDELGAGL